MKRLLLAAALAAAAPLPAEETIRIGLAAKVPKSSVRLNHKEGKLNGKPYRGKLLLVPAGGGLVTVVNELPLEDYLRGVVPGEMSPGWPSEALKAQAVVARSYAVANKGRFGKHGYDLCATAACQVYGGRRVEKPSTDAAVAATRGEVILHKDKPISAVFHSCCGGQTDDSSDVWRGESVKYLRGAKCRWCRGASPHFQWAGRISEEDLARSLKRAGHDLGRVKSIRIPSRTRAGRAHEVRVTGEKGAATLQANAFRLIVGSSRLRSTWWTGVSRSDGHWVFNGKGWGHGVGLCQWCARATAEKGYKYKEILAYFYKNSRVRKP